MHQMLTKRQLYRLKQSLHLGEAPLPEETTSKPLMMFSLRETIEECPEFKRASPFIGGIMTLECSAVTWQECLLRHLLDNNCLSPASSERGLDYDNCVT